MAYTDVQISDTAASTRTVVSIEADYSGGKLALIIYGSDGSALTLTFNTNDDLDAFVQKLWGSRV